MLDNIEMVRENRLVKELVLLDGFPRAGKSVLGGVLSSFERVEIQRSEPILEDLSLLYNLNKIKMDVAVALLRREMDLMLYNSMISRNTNFRIRDRTGVLNNANHFRYFKRLFFKDGDVVLERIQREKPIFQVEVHNMLEKVDLYFEAFGKDLKIFEMVRHPVDLIIKNNKPPAFANDLQLNPRLWAPVFKIKNRYIPYYALGWDEEFKRECSFNRAIKILQRQTEKTRMKYKSLSKTQKSQILFIPFEKFVVSPYKYLDLISNFIGSEVTGKTKRALKMQKVPRIINPVVK